MSELVASAPRAVRRSRPGWLCGLLTLVLLGVFGVLLGSPTSADSLPAGRASTYVPADATRGKVTLQVGDTEVPAELQDARIPGRAVPAAMSASAFSALPGETAPLADETWLREAVTPAEGSLPTRYRLRVVTARGVLLMAQDWGGPGLRLGLALDGLLELPADVSAGRTWSSTGVARSRSGAETSRYTNDSTASAPEDPARLAEGCLSVASRTVLDATSDKPRRTWTETSLWCPGKGVVAGSGELDGTAYAVTSGGAPTPVDDADLATAPWSTDDLATWQVRTPAVLAGDETFGLTDAGPTGALDPSLPPVVAANGVVVLPSLDGGDLVGLLPAPDRPDDDSSVWAHWWERPGGQITALGSTGSLVLAPTTAHRIAAYRAGRTLAWNAPLDDVAAAPPLPIDDQEAVAVATVSGRLSLLDARTGVVRWERPVGAGVHDPLAAGDGVVVTADAGSDVTAWDVASGQQRWQVDDAASPFSTTLLVTDDEVVVVANGIVTAYDAADGRRLWVREGGLGLDRVALVGDQLWLGVGRDLRAWSVHDGSSLWSRDATVPATTAASRCSPPTGSSTGLARTGGQLVALDATGRLLGTWTVPVDADDTVTVSCRGAGVDVTAYAPDGSRPLRVIRVAAP